MVGFARPAPRPAGWAAAARAAGPPVRPADVATIGRAAGRFVTADAVDGDERGGRAAGAVRSGCHDCGRPFGPADVCTPPPGERLGDRLDATNGEGVGAASLRALG